MYTKRKRKREHNCAECGTHMVQHLDSTSRMECEMTRLCPRKARERWLESTREARLTAVAKSSKKGANRAFVKQLNGRRFKMYNLSTLGTAVTAVVKRTVISHVATLFRLRKKKTNWLGDQLLRGGCVGVVGNWVVSLYECESRSSEIHVAVRSR